MRRALLLIFFLAAWLAFVTSATYAQQSDALTLFASKHYTIHTNLTRDEVIDFARQMDRVFVNYEKRFNDFHPRNSNALVLYLFRTQDQYLAFMTRHGLRARNTGGMFFVQPHIEGLATWTEQRSRSQTFAVLQHEGFHQFAWHYIGHELPVWLNEGLAQYYEDGVIIRKTMKLGLADADRIERVRQAIASDQTLPIDHVLRISNDDWSNTLTADPDRASLLYAQVWSMVYFLIHADDGRYQKPLARYLKLVSDGHESRQAFRAAFGTEDLSPMGKRWRKFAKAHQPDPITTAMTRLEFFGAALRFMHERRETLPTHFEALKRNMQQRHFTLRRTSIGVTTTLRADDESLFTFNRPNGVPGRFILLEPAKNNLPPRIAAVGLRPEPTLVWAYSDTGELVLDIEFR